MSNTNQFEASAKTAEIKNNAIGQADLDDALIGQALSIFQGLRQSKLADTMLPIPSSDQVLPPVIGNQRELISGLLSGPCDQAQTIRNSGKCDTVDRNRLGETIGDLINDTRDQLPTGRRSGKIDRATMPNSIDSKGIIGPNGELPPFLPTTLKESLRRLQNEINGPDNIILCAYRIPPEGNHSIQEWLKPNRPSDVVLCSAKTPITGEKPGPGNYYACVYYYPLKIKDGVIQIQRQSD